MLAPPKTFLPRAAAALQPLRPLARHRLAAIAVAGACVVPAVAVSLATDERYETVGTAVLVERKGAPSLETLRRRTLRGVARPAGATVFVLRDAAHGQLVAVARAGSGAESRALARAAALRLVVVQLGVDEDTLARRLARAERALVSAPAGSSSERRLRRQVEQLRSIVQSFDQLYEVGSTTRLSGSKPVRHGLVALGIGLALAAAVAIGLDGLERRVRRS